MGYNVCIRADLKMVSFFDYLIFFIFKMASFLQYLAFLGAVFCTQQL